MADRLAGELARHDYEPWLDRAEIQGGEEWSRSIEAAIDACDAMVAVLTRGSYESRICRGEQGRALRKNKLLVPLLAQADAERPVYLESAHYLDFTDPHRFHTGFSQLLEAIRGGRGVRIGDLPGYRRKRLPSNGQVQSLVAPLRDRSADWAQIRALADQQRKRFLDVLSPRPGRLGIFEPDLYVRRASVEGELSRFLDGDATAFALIGDSGIGKTNLACHWAGDAVAGGHAVLMYHGDRLSSTTVERELSRDLGLEDSGELSDALERVDALAREAARRLVIVFDGVNRFRGRQSEGPRDLVLEIDALVARLAGTGVRVVLTCTTGSWSRLERLGTLNLSWNRYHRTATNEEIVVLSEFDQDEAEAAYALYRDRLGLTPLLPDLPTALRLRLRKPLLLRFFAETSQGAPVTSDDAVLDTLIQHYLADRLRLRDDRLFVHELVGEMHERRRAALPLQSLARHPELGPAVRDEGADSAYGRLLDAGVLVEVEGDGLFEDDLVRFAYPLIGAHALAGRLLQESSPVGRMATELVELSDELPFAWEAAAILLARRGDDETHLSLAASPLPELRELAVEGLVRLHAGDPERARGILMGLLDGDSTDGQRTGLRAAFNIGPDTRDLFEHAAMRGSEKLRRAVRDTLYLIWNGHSGPACDSMASIGYFLWRQAPDFTYGLMRDLVAQVSWLRPRTAGRILGFVLDLTITIYVNHCEREDVAEQTAELYHELTVNRLHLDRITLGGRLERLVLRMVAAVFSKRILGWMLTGDEDGSEAFFDLPAGDREILVELAGLLDPQAEMGAAEELVGRALASEVGVFRGTAALVCAVHAHAHFPEMEPMLRRLFEGLDGRGRVWLMAGFSVLLPTTPAAWIPLLEDFTRRFLDEHPDLVGERPGLLGTLDVVFLPLGLAYGKRGEGMPLFQELISAGPGADQDAAVARVISGLGPVGFYHPRPVLELLRSEWNAVTSPPACEEELVTSLGTMRTLHVDRVDGLLAKSGAEPGLQRRVAAAADVDLVHRFVHLLGYFNNAVHYCLYYPRMRRDLGVFALELLAEASTPNDFIVGYTERAIGKARAAEFRLLEWTLPLET